MKYVIVILTIALASCTASRQPTRFCVVVDEVRYGKRVALIRPKSFAPKPVKYWYYYPSLNVHAGDTVDISINDRKEPKF